MYANVRVRELGQDSIGNDYVADLRFLGGPKGIRTPDLMAASHALYQLSYGPQADRKFTQPDEAASESCHLTLGASRHSRSRS